LNVNFPEGYKELYVASFGETAWEAYRSAMAQPFARGLRVNPLRVASSRPLPLEAPIPWAANGYYLSLQSGIGNDPLHAAGCIYLQEPTAMAPVAILNPQQGENILDLCAAPGGKSTQIGALMKQEGFLLVNDPHPARAEALAENVERLGLTHTAIANVAPAQLTRAYETYFDGILVDAPCSGEGLFRREPDASLHWSVDQLIPNAARQLEILEAAYQMLEPGGRIVYSTCTFNPIENEFVCAKFAMNHPDMRLVPTQLPDSDEALSPLQLRQAGAGHPLIQRALDTLDPAWIELPTQYATRYFPQHCHGEGHFIARFEKQVASSPSHRTPAPSHGLTIALTKRLQKEFDTLASSMLSAEFLHTLLHTRSLQARGDTLYALTEGAQRIHTLLRPGLALMRLAYGHAVPHHSLALAMRAQDAQRELRLPYGDQRILDYLHGQTITCGNDNGWTLVTVEGAPLGWGKAVGGILKNHYPKGLRRTYAFATDDAKINR
jgi:16S rRNA C967 or C1407 C5-methylase (RsmB/RsmF family)/NOL1/NOP2/fmu family ribosome biogenesis protein